MPPRRGAPPLNSLSPQDAPMHSASTPPSPAYMQFPQARSNSPSGFAHLLSKSSRWFRKPSDPRLASGASEPRSSTSSVAVRKPKISRPTDPRPIFQGFQPESRVSDASKSVLDLSSKKSFDLQRPFPTSQPSSPDVNGSLGDLRSISRKTWSKSADDLGNFSASSYSSADISFQHRVEEYRNRSNSSATLHPIHSGPGSPVKHIFPTIVTDITLSSSPPEGGFVSPDPGISISVSSPTSDAFVSPPSEEPPHVHSRNTSFAPRLPSKLSASKLGFSPTSPKRKGSGSERDAESTKDKDNDRSGPNGTRGVFPFGLASPSSSKLPLPNPTSLSGQNTTSSSSPLLAPTMLKPDAYDSHDSRRTSQIVYNAGFINRMGDAAPSIYAHYRPYSTATNLTLSKGWKSFKAELKGSKLYFYKAPSDRSAAIKELFPTEIVPALEDDEVDVEADTLDDLRASRGRDDGAGGRKKRAYWGRRTHPDLVRGEGGIEKGTFEALLHETVFATTFLQHSGEEQSASTGEPRRPEWKDLSSAVLLCLPILVGRESFENEFTRLCDNLVSGADEKTKNFERSCVSWMAGEYLRYHGVPADEPGWDAWRKETIPAFSWNKGSASGMPKSTSTQAVFAPSPNPGMYTPSMTGSTFSPNLGTFSPRPGDDAKMASLMEALGTPGLQAPASSVKPISPRQQRLQHPFADPKQRVWTLLAQDGFTREVLSLLDPTSVAHSLRIFHRRILQQLPDNLTSDHILKADSDPGASPDQGAGATTGSSPSAALFGSEDRPHWLTRLLLMQILGADPSSSSGVERSASSRTHSRSEVISMWARIGELCRIAGDECSWMAISAALCSRPVARLSKAWRRADRQSIMAIESWIYPGGDGQVALINGPVLTPWGGEIRDRAKHLLEQAREERTDEVWATKPLLQTRDLFEGLRTKVSLCPRNPSTDNLPHDVEKLLDFWQDFVEEKGNQSSTLAAKFQRVDQFMSLSLAAEPRRKGLFEPFFWSHSMSTPHTLCHPLTPLLFVDPLPTVTLIDRAQIWRGRLESGPTKLSVDELQRLRGLDVALTPASRRADASSSKDKLFNIGDVDIRETAIPVYDGELLLVARSDLDPLSSSRPPSRAPSRPPSSVVEGNSDKPMTRAPSIRVKPGSSQGLERKSSVARRSSLPSISSRPNAMVTEVSSERPIRVIVQAGTLDRLVNVLVHGLQGVSVAVADDNGETSLRDGKTRDLVVDRAEFARVWWHVFRSFVTPIVFFELLRKRFLGSRPSSQPSSTSSLHVIQFRSEVLEAIKDWITSGGGAQDCLDDVQLFEAVRSFLESPLDRASLDASTMDGNDVRQAWDALDSARQMTLAAFTAQTRRPPSAYLANARPLNSTPRVRSFGNQSPDVDAISADELVENLNAMGSAALSNISEEDLFITADLLEVQSADRTGWFSTREVPSTDDIDIQSMYSHMTDVQPSSLISELSQDTIYRLLPPSIRSCIRAFNILRKWTISKLVAPKLGIRVRQARMDLFLRAIEIARLRSMNAGSASLGCGDRPCVRSFVEAVLSSAIVSSESRMHHRPWQNLANIRGVQCDSLVGLLSRPAVPKKSYGDVLAIDVSWILERMLELVSIPNVVMTSGENDQCIINLDKRRHLCNLILTTPSLAKRSRPREEVDRKDFERLNNIEREMNLISLDHRSIRDEAQREALQSQGNVSASAKRTVRPFQRLVAMQQEKYKRDKYLHDRLSKDKKQEQLRNERRDDQINKAMRSRKPMTQVQKQHRMKKSYSSAFFQLMRPISSAFTDSTHATALKRSPAELDFSPSGKPSLVLSVVDARVAQFINNERSFTFQLDTEDGGHYLLQAISKQEMVRWIEQINRVAKLAAKRRLTYLGNSPKPQLADHIHDHPSATTASRDPRAVFGVELEFLLEREANGAQPEIGSIPSVMLTCLSEVEYRGLSEVGIYRVAGATSEVNALREAFNRGECPITPDTDIHSVCDLVKSWFRLLPEPVFPSSSYFNVIEAMKLENLNSRLACIRSVVHGLPQANFDLLKRVTEHLDRVTDYEEHNQMAAEALAIVFSPNLLRAPQNDFALILANMGHTHKLVKALITHFHVIFDDELEADHDVEEDEMEEPILEEDEEEEIDSPAAGDES
ncbi:hypothetical protein DEU56DRAFT_727081 [Suillus clintonianus]|uniref:uncharacterized protein n=1 Tax=Suillus clintonianus TaxID=1904413 RepID=UPI001B86C607|nr:uncharacterized protein DEU56DRAFT_727081 [Suillus clintonianus]KAG2153395.1 hypothetical protein DEU56DRAFT_727081 [Suillus clintonianus]